MRTVPLIIALLTLYFSIGDIFGEKRISQIESKWLVLSDRVFKNWKLVFDNYKYWFLLLLFLVVGLLFFLIIAFVIVWLFLYITQFALAFRGFLGILAAVLWLILVSIAIRFLPVLLSSANTLWIVNTIPFSKIDIKTSPLELKYIRGFLHSMLNYFGEFDKRRELKNKHNSLFVDEEDFWTFIVDYFYALLSAFSVPIIVTLGLAMRLIFSIFYFAFWLIFLGPPKFLYFISKKTGAKSYFNVGKYLLLVISTIVYLLTQK